ncbi:M13 family metallopeptidase [Parvicella tangerina]|uniref:Neutral endopeptidase n=1 Tax=Parvicella tangerina TaxID=2829795 RepID=A0A916JQ81_9FLAO|nr:M13 family metallopeptidase [Parvicella tangerina]CAG5086656.1 Neutral endopeptidase [Parvicella tangerina]
MKSFIQITIASIAMAALMLNCAQEEEHKDSEASQDEVAASGGELESLDFAAMDTTVDPTVDFYEYACGTWLAENPIPEEESRWSNFNVLNDNNNDILKNLLEDAQANPGEEGAAKQLIGDLYHSFSDTAHRNEMGLEPIQPVLTQIDAMASKEDLLDVLVSLHSIGVDAGFGLFVEQDAKLNDRYAAYLGQGGFGLPNRDYYFNTDDRSIMIREEYDKHLNKMFDLVLGNTEKEAAYQMEEDLAADSWPPVKLRNIEAQYNKMTVSELEELAPGFAWKTYLDKRGANVDSIIVGQKEFMTKFASLVQDKSIDDWKTYLKWTVINHTASNLTMDLERADFAFYSTVLRGTKKMKPLWKRGVMMVTQSPVGEALGQVFVEENFTPDAKKKVNEMVDNIILVFDERIEQLDWMSDETKVKAKEKLSSFARKLGFPDVWKSYEGLKIVPDNYVQNTFALARFEVEDNLNRLGKEINKDEWHMAPQIVNAYYNPLLNEIVFPAGIMQKPFFSEHFEDAVNYARMGAVIGHELTHGFDDMGSQFDATGAMVNWWTKEDKEKFDAKTQLLIDQYNDYEVLEGVFVNGELTLGENIADLGGLTIAYHAYQKSLEGKEDEVINGYTGEQRFFIAFGQVWQNNIRENALVQRVNNDPHSPGKYRVNGVVSNMPEFFEAFDVQEGDPMRQPADKIARIW